MSTAKPDIGLEDALSNVNASFRTRLVTAYNGLKRAFVEGNHDACGLRAGRFCEVAIRLLQEVLTATHTPFGTRIENFKTECDNLERTPKTAGPESLRILLPRALSFVYTLRNKRGIGHEGGDVDANAIDAAAGVRVADWCICELIRIYHRLSLEEAQSLCDALAQRELPHVWEVFGRKRVLDPRLSYSDQTLLLLYSCLDAAVPEEDLLSWTEHSNPRVYRRDILRRLHRARLIEYDAETRMVLIAPPGVFRVEKELLAEH
jgi:hypothetical protein